MNTHHCSAGARAARMLAATALAAVALLAFVPTSTRAQGGPPLVTDDPGTPGDGHWEINLAGVGTHTPGRWEIAAPDADINYGWGDRVQLKLDVPWSVVREEGERWKTGIGAFNVGVKWRFIDEEQAGFAMSTYPQVTHSWFQSSVRRGIAEPGTQVFLPIEASTDINGYGVAFEAGRNFVSDGPNEWEAGGVVAHACGATLECLAEVHERFAPHTSQTLVNLGARWKLSESFSILAAAGREFGRHADDQQRALIYLGVQIVR